jgi:hypothetical protein
LAVGSVGWTVDWLAENSVFVSVYYLAAVWVATTVARMADKLENL